MQIHILGICGTFMGSLAIIARQLGHQVSGSDANVYPPMSTQLLQQNITLFEGYKAAHLQPRPDLVIIGNALSRGNPAVEYVLNEGIPYTSGPQWLADHLLVNRHVLAVSGTHGKTSTASMLAWLLLDNGMDPGYLIGGVPANMGVSADVGGARFFVIEADEYDSAFFDKRSKFVHYRPTTLIINNLEFDHADIFPDLAAIQTQFHHLLRMVPGNGRIIVPAAYPAIEQVLQRGCWSNVQTLALSGAGDWQAIDVADDGSEFTVAYQGQHLGKVNWGQLGLHNVSNGLAAVAASVHSGVKPEAAVASLAAYKGVKRRLEVIGTVNGISLYDDFAHHPTAIATTLQGLRANLGQRRVIAVLEPRSNTMRMGVHQGRLGASAEAADRVIWYQPADVDWDLAAELRGFPNQTVSHDLTEVINDAVAAAGPGDAIVVMSNGGFGGIHQKLLAALAK